MWFGGHDLVPKVIETKRRRRGKKKKKKNEKRFV